MAAPSRIIHSTLARAAETARLVAEGVECDLIPDDGLREVCLGVKEGKPEGDPEDDFISAWLAGEHIDGAESFELFRQRIMEAITRSIAPDGVNLVIGHWGMFAAVSRTIDSPVFDPEHCTLYKLSQSCLRWVLDRA